MLGANPVVNSVSFQDSLRPTPPRVVFEAPIWRAAFATLTLATLGCNLTTSVAPAGSCPIAHDYEARHIVFWPASATQDLLDRLLRGDAPAVRFDGCRVEFVESCHVRGQPYVRSMNHQVDVHASDVMSDFATLVGVADGQPFQQKSSVHILERGAVGIADPAREFTSECDEATHVVAQVIVGAFSVNATIQTKHGIERGASMEACETEPEDEVERSAKTSPDSEVAPLADTKASVHLSLVSKLDDVTDDVRKNPTESDLQIGADPRSVFEAIWAPQCRIPVTIQLVPVPQRWIAAEGPKCPEGTRSVNGACVPEASPSPYTIPPVDEPTTARFQATITKLQGAMGNDRVAYLYELAQLYCEFAPADDASKKAILVEYVDLTTNRPTNHQYRKVALSELLDTALASGDDEGVALSAALLVAEFPNDEGSLRAFFELARYYCRKGDTTLARRTIEDLLYRRSGAISKKTSKPPSAEVVRILQEASTMRFEECSPPSASATSLAD